MPFLSPVMVPQGDGAREQPAHRDACFSVTEPPPRAPGCPTGIRSLSVGRQVGAGPVARVPGHAAHCGVGPHHTAPVPSVILQTVGLTRKQAGAPGGAWAAPAPRPPRAGTQRAGCSQPSRR